MAYRRRVQTIFEWLEPASGDCILDAGCGRGYYLKFFGHACNLKIVGVELERPYLTLAKKNLGESTNTQLINASLYDLPFPDNHFDKVIASEVLEHIPDDRRALQSVCRVLRPGGLVAITVPNMNYPYWWDPINRTLETLFGRHIQTGMFAGIWANHVRLYDRQTLERTIGQAGLEIVSKRSFTHHCFPFIHNIVYGLGKTLLEADMLPQSVASAADRNNISGNRGGTFNPVNLGLLAFEWFDRSNSMNEPEGRSSVNLCALARKP